MDEKETKIKELENLIQQMQVGVITVKCADKFPSALTMKVSRANASAQALFGKHI